MDLLFSIPDNLTELLVKILRFTELRRAVLYQNMHNTRTVGYVPQDMPVLEFVHALSGAKIGRASCRERVCYVV